MKIKNEPYSDKDFDAETRKVFSVTDLNREVRGLLESAYASVWVEGEISNFKRHSSGHIYLTLKDDKSQLPAVFFSRMNQGLKFEPKDGLQVLAMGRVSLYESRGQFQLYIERLEPKGLGALQLAFLQLKEKLEREGLFEHARKRPIPKFPRTVGVVTSPTGAAIRDILNVVNRRFSGTHVLLNPVPVQGEGAAARIAVAIREMNSLEGIDVLIVGRGGGSLEDLWCFNEEAVARAIYESRIPVISAVGHEIDWTISDLVADLRAPTPSAAAELVVQNREELVKCVDAMSGRLAHAARTLVREQKARLLNLSESYAFRQPGVLIEQYAQRVDELLRQVHNYTRALLSEKRQTFAAAAGKLRALSPLAILERGYSLSFTDSGKLLKDVRQVKVGETVKTRLSRGVMHAEVKRVEVEGENGND